MDRLTPRRASAGCACEDNHAGTVPNTTPVTSDRSKVKASTTGDGVALIGIFFARGKARASIAYDPAYASANPIAPPIELSNTLSVSIWRMTLRRDAPSAVRTAISARRAVHR